MGSLKWVIIAAVIVGVVWLMGSGGVNYMFKKYTTGPVGADARADVRNEAGLSGLGQYLLSTFQYSKAARVFRTAMDRYPNGENYWWNLQRLGRCREKQGQHEETVNILEMLIQANAHEKDSRVPTNDALKLRAEKLINLHDLR